MTLDLFRPVTGFESAIADLKRDLRNEGGPQISTMRNYRFALLVYKPEDEFRARRHISRMVSDLEEEGWRVLTVDIAQTLLSRVKAAGEDAIAHVIRSEKKSADRPERALNFLAEKMTQLTGAEEGLATDIARQIRTFIDAHPEDADRTLVLLGRAGAMYPWFRVSALLKQLGSRVVRVPVVLLYPGERTADGALRFMGELDPDRDYRPRIYA